MIPMVWTVLELMVQNNIEQGMTLDDSVTDSVNTYRDFRADLRKELEA